VRLGAGGDTVALVPDKGLNAQQLEQLRRWGIGLETDGREEVSAAGRAILLLIEEVERLHVLVWDRQLYPEAPVAIAEPAEELHRSLARRLRRLRELERPSVPPQADSPPERPFHT
jgi:hypothetical protein